MNISPDAILAALITFELALIGAMWKLATMLAEIRGEIRHNGGGSLKDRIHSIGRTVDEIRISTTGHSDSLKGLDGRITDHRRRNDDAIQALRDHLDSKLALLGDARADAIRAALHDIEERDRP